jgi:hypothetical protein
VPMETHFYKFVDSYQYNNKVFHNFIVKCDDSCFTGRVTTPNEVMRDPEYIKKRFPDAHSTSIPTTWRIKYTDIIERSNAYMVYTPFVKLIKQFHDNNKFV